MSKLNLAGPFQAKPLPWPADSLSKFVSLANTNNHYANHYTHYISNLNNSDAATSGLTLDQLMVERVDRVGDNARQAWNHEFFWGMLNPKPDPIQDDILKLVTNQYGSFDHFKEVFEKRVHDHFASGWIWLCWDPQQKVLMIVDGQDSYNPLQDGYYPLLTLDVWEHSVEPDYSSDKDTYCKNFWQYVNWSKVNRIVQENITGAPTYYQNPVQTL
jgi:superoxide dismutase, Fe-Mn family